MAKHWTWTKQVGDQKWTHKIDADGDGKPDTNAGASYQPQTTNEAFNQTSPWASYGQQYGNQKPPSVANLPLAPFKPVQQPGLLDRAKSALQTMATNAARPEVPIFGPKPSPTWDSYGHQYGGQPYTQQEQTAAGSQAADWIAQQNAANAGQSASGTGAAASYSGVNAYGQDPAWWGAFQTAHAGADPVTFYKAGGVFQTDAEALSAALRDKAWGEQFAASYKRPPTEDDWKYHWNNPNGGPNARPAGGDTYYPAGQNASAGGIVR